MSIRFTFLNLFIFSTLYAQNGFISGKILSLDSEPMPGANISIKNRNMGAMSNLDGTFTIENLAPGSYELNISYIGHKPISRFYVITSDSDQEDKSILGKIGVDENFEDEDVIYGDYHSNQIFNIEPDAVALRQVDVTAHELQKKISDILKQTVFGPSKIRESYLTTSSSMDAVSIKDIKMSPALNFYEGLDELKEIEAKQQSTVYTTLNVRGQGTTTSRSYSQLVDGMQSFQVSLGNTFGNITGISEIDVANVELIHGAASVMYGPYSTDGLVLMSTKNPWFYNGLSYQIKTGFNYKSDVQSTPFSHTALRYAKAYDKFAFKLVFSDKRATEWIEPDDDSTFIKLTIDQDPSIFDLSRRHGDDTPVNQIAIGEYSGNLGPIVRTGYWENDLMPNAVYNSKANASLRYKISDDIEISYDVKGGWGSHMFLNLNKEFRNHAGGHNHGFGINGKRWSIRGYSYTESRNPFVKVNNNVTTEPRGLSLSLQAYSKPDSVWYNDFINAYNGNVEGFASEDFDAARDFADSENSISDGNYRARLQPGTDEFEKVVDSLNTINPNIASDLSDNNFKNLEFIYDLTDFVKFGGLQVGGSFRQYELGFDNGSMSNTKEINKIHGELTPWEYAVFVQSTKWFFNERLKLQGALRLDDSDSYGKNLAPSFSTVVKTLENHFLRFSFQQASLNPSFVWAYLDFNGNPGSRAIGGTAANKKRLGLEDLTHLVFVDFEANDTTHRYVPEPSAIKLTAYEMGYKALVNDNWYLDMNYYYNHRTNLRDDGYFGFDPAGTTKDEENETWNLGDAYYIYSHGEHLEEKINGLSMSSAYNFENGLILSGNYNFISEAEEIFSSNSSAQAGVVGTSRPRNRYKLTLNHPRALNKNLGYSISARYAEEYWFDSFQWYGVGQVGGDWTIDSQISYIWSEQNILFKAGINNVLGKPYKVTANSPKVGSTFYLALEYDGLIR